MNNCPVSFVCLFVCCTKRAQNKIKESRYVNRTGCKPACHVTYVVPAYLVFTSLELCRWRGRSAQLSFQVCDTRLRGTLLSNKRKPFRIHLFICCFLSCRKHCSTKGNSKLLCLVLVLFRYCPTSACFESVFLGPVPRCRLSSSLPNGFLSFVENQTIIVQLPMI